MKHWVSILVVFFIYANAALEWTSGDGGRAVRRFEMARRYLAYRG
jgi:hypothetical protein